jgi:hypothetical protein
MSRKPVHHTPRTPKTVPFWHEWGKVFVVPFIAFIGSITVALVTFYFATKAELDEHTKQFVEIGKKFDQFNTTMVKNYDDYAKSQTGEKEARDKMREQFTTLFQGMATKLSNIDAQTAVQGERYNNLKSALDQIQSTQQRNIVGHK